MRLIRSALHEFFEDRCGTVAAALAYFTAFSMPALLMIAVTIAGAMVGTDSAAREVQRQLGSVLSPQVAGQTNVLLEHLYTNVRRGSVGTFIGLAAILLVATKAFAELHRVMNRAWKVETVDTGFRKVAMRRLSAFFLIVTISVLVLASMVFGTIVLVFSRELSTPLFYVWQLVAPAVLLTLLVAAVFKILPDARIQWRDVWFGAAVTGILLAISKHALSFYFSRSVVGSVFGATSSFALLLLWLYFSYAVLLFGAELTQVWAKQQGRPAQPTESAIRVDRTNPAA
jgi:membrane protein